MAYEKGTDENGHAVYLVGDDWLSRDEAAEYAQAEADALAAQGDSSAYEGYPAEIAPEPKTANIELTEQDLVILDRMSAKSSQHAAPLSWAGWQPHENDAPKVGSMIKRGILRKKPGFDSIELTDAGHEAYEDALDRRAARLAAERGY